MLIIFGMVAGVVGLGVIVRAAEITAYLLGGGAMILTSTRRTQPWKPWVQGLSRTVMIALGQAGGVMLAVEIFRTGAGPIFLLFSLAVLAFAWRVPPMLVSHY